MNMRQALNMPVLKDVVNDVANIYISCAEGVINIVAESTRASQGDDTLPPVARYQLATLSHSPFCTFVATHRQRLVTSV